ncbi:MAG: Periplasmic serine endoprotease DegP [Chlamydiae bacterium]|nr:Periplasmic serine endoprotease DegP [Chlamydiota bacterium]
MIKRFLLSSFTILTLTISATAIPQSSYSLENFTSVAKEAIPAVVSVKVEFQSTPQQKFLGSPFQQKGNDPFGDDFWNRFFQVPQRESRPSIGQGSGFLVSEDGYLLTNNHIVDNAETVTVTLKNGKEYEAKVIGRDPNTDVAVLKIEGKNFPYLKLGNSNILEVGQWVIAIGNPLGLSATLTVGVVSAIDRSNLGLTPIENFIQTDAAINRGNSGGPLLNLRGEVVGMNTAIATNTGGYMGIGFAIPSNLAEHIMEQLIHNGTFTRGYLGVVLQQVDHGLADAFDLDDVQGALVADVAKDSPAEKAGLKRGDVILRYNGKVVDNISVIRNAVSIMKPDEVIRLQVKRGKSIKNIDVKVGKHPGNVVSASESVNQLGVQVTELTPDLKKKYGYDNEKGVVVSSVSAGSVAQLAGIKAGSLIISVNHQDVITPEEFYQNLNESDAGRPVLLLVKQGNITHYVSLKSSKK